MPNIVEPRLGLTRADVTALFRRALSRLLPSHTHIHPHMQARAPPGPGNLPVIIGCLSAVKFLKDTVCQTYGSHSLPLTLFLSGWELAAFPQIGAASRACLRACVGVCLRVYWLGWLDFRWHGKTNVARP